jgi:hypothetical protein
MKQAIPPAPKHRAGSQGFEQSSRGCALLEV